MIDPLLKVIEESDPDGVSQWWKIENPSGARAWEVHLALFSLVQRVLNPPFINPHLPKLEPLPPRSPPGSSVSFAAFEAAIRENNPEMTAILMNSFIAQNGTAELARNLLLLGSGYLEQSLGHSVSCTAFILLEMMERSDQDSWPAITLLADYFCKGQFHMMAEVPGKARLRSEEILGQHLMRAASGNGIVNLHHTITRYAIERVRHLLSEAEYAHVISRWIEFIGEKATEAPVVLPVRQETPEYSDFFRDFSRRDEGQVLQYFAGMLSAEQGRRTMGQYLLKGVCDLYQGQYNPHFLTGLGSALWVADRYRESPTIALNALRQYVNFFFAREQPGPGL